MSIRPRPVRVSREHRYPNLSVAEVWRLLADTESFHRRTSLPPMIFSPLAYNNTGYYRTASLKIFQGIRVRWTELPYEWVGHQRFSLMRSFESTPFESMITGVEIRPGNPGTVVRAFTQVAPRISLAWPLAHFAGICHADLVHSYCRKISRIQLQRARGLQEQENPDVQVREKKLNEAMGLMLSAPLERSLLEPLRELLLNGNDDEVLHIRAADLAMRWSADRTQVLQMLLYAAKAGVLDLDWRVLCPVCRVPKAGAGQMRFLPSRVRCDVCAKEYETELGEAVELTFTVNSQVRKIPEQRFSVGGPLETPHILIQQYLKPGESRHLRLNLDEGPYQARVLRLNDLCAVNAVPDRYEGSEDHLSLRYTAQGWKGKETRYSPGKVVLELRNESRRDIVVVLEQTQWSGNVSTAFEVATLQEFRDLFPSEILPPRRRVQAQALTVMFTDLGPSTRLYEDMGEEEAYSLVRSQVEILRKIVQQNRGTLVKTMGDATLSVFMEPAKAVAAAFGIRTALQSELGSVLAGTGAGLRVGLCSGPASLVNAEGRIDYFGRTVNLAARIRDCAGVWEILMPREMAQDLDVEEVLSGMSASMADHTLSLESLGSELRLIRLPVRGHNRVGSTDTIVSPKIGIVSPD
ncbi:MAG: adenylate/guanylate cyclase domain-containing protein [Candidatus Omnitrophica bacterium]|nr:adenylate/guanylate cyclase domain-containing protein [Candidatus Omnitrophota bacterium]